MDFTFTEEQQMLQDTTRRFIARDYSFDTRRERARAAREGRADRKVWQGLADLGLTALNVPEEDGGLGGNAIDTMLVMTALGEGLVLEPFLSSAVMATKALATLGSPAQKEAMLPALASGEMIAVFAHDEAASRFDWKAIETSAREDDGSYVLNGRKSMIAYAPHADVLLVTARIEGPDQPGALAVFAVPKDAAGLRITPFPMVDGAIGGEILLDDVTVPAQALLGESSDDAESRIGEVLDAGLAAICAEAVGALDKLLAATVEYARTRKQFGVPIGKFQALQHRMADMVLHIEQARSMAYLASVRCTDTDLARRRRDLSAAKVVVGQACRFVGQQAVQLHGGMGVTDELDVSHYFKRLMAIEMQFGSTDTHLEQVAAALA
ncbi:acyl-CoA dehydrogenase family protein|uniref:acyl-CoA dehydrogenase family protein n=1 Tax=Noviherbaspirillum sp. L7-7A TaxID=2850560 RepID=UPI001C2BDBDE|nr:acyl-CoA dehydrogenase family protein [Noviherbaspirillum sp. L7-7A]MBV0878238.1 acyl-CoA dehydrogenase family protein [Noviherbaspirillum sp. L7-7A]